MEKLEPVVAEAQLLVGMMVRLLPTRCCGQQVDLLLTRRVRKGDILPGGRASNDGWMIANECCPVPAGLTPNFCTLNVAISDRRLFIVDVGDTREISYEREREKAE